MKKKVMLMSDSPMSNTGFATIGMNVCNGVSDEYEVHYLAHNYWGQPLAPPLKFLSGDKIDFTIHGAGAYQYCQDVITQRIRENGINVFGILLDTFMLHGDFRKQVSWFNEIDTAPAKTFFYFPSDGGEQLPQFCEDILRRVDIPIAMAKFGQKQAKELYGINAEYIPHAINPIIFNPLFKKEKKIELGLSDKFVVGSVFRNQPRKMPDRLIKIFAEFAKGKDDVILYLHCDINDPASPIDLVQLINRYKINNKIFLTGNKFYKGTSYKDMGAIYKPMDVFVLTTSGEGFGIPIIEAMSCEIPVLATDYTTTPELVLDHSAGLGIKTVAEITGSWNVERGVCDIQDGVDKLNLMYDDWKKGGQKLKEWGKNGRKAVLEEYSWDVVLPMWKDVLKRLSE